MATVFVAGGASYDSILHVEEFFEPRPQTIFSSSFHEVVGGTGAGKALALARLFADVRLHCLLGDDPAGQVIRERLGREPIQLLTDTDPAGTERHVNIMNRHGERISIYARYATFDPVVEFGPLESHIAAADYVVINIMNYCRKLLPLATAHGKRIWCDIHDYDGSNPYHADFIEAADFLFMSSEGMADWRGFMRSMIHRGKELVVCTHGCHGSTLLDARGVFRDAPIVDDYPRVDSNGAGDSFMSGYLHAFARGFPPEVAQDYATISGGLCVASRELLNESLSEAFLDREYARLFGSK